MLSLVSVWFVLMYSPFFAGATVELMAGLAIAYPGYVSTTIMGTQLLGDQATRVQHQQQEGLLTLASGLPMLAYIQESWENAHGQYPVTLAFLNLAYQLVSAGVNSGLVKVSWCAQQN